MATSRSLVAGHTVSRKVFLVAALLALVAPAAWGNSVSYSLDDFAVFGGSGVFLSGNGITVAGRTGSNGGLSAFGTGVTTGPVLTGGGIYFDEGSHIGAIIANQSVFIPDGSTVGGGIDAGGTPDGHGGYIGGVYLGPGATVAGSVTAGGGVYLGLGATVTGAISQGVPEALRQTMAAVDASARRTDFDASDPLILISGTTQVLSAGAHYYTSIDAESNVVLHIDPWVSGRTATAPVSLFVTGNVTFGNGLQVFILNQAGAPVPFADALADPVLSAAALAGYAETHGNWSSGGQWLGTMYAPDGSIYLSTGTATGPVWAGGNVNIYDDVNIYGGTRVGMIPEPLTLAG
ncbi:MAG: hypothetical protein IMZ65_03910, partial [Planctomycetes bacterium]|nr:hypothetical protein [Planctomycetota bacterium]